MQLVQTCLYVGNILQRCFNRRGGALKHMQACLSSSKDRGSSFLLCGGGANLFMCGKHPTTPFLTAKVVL